jgi:hypothetical protein
VKILDRLPYLECSSSVAVRDEIVRIKPYQIILWVSISRRDVTNWGPPMPRFPAILDTGLNHNFAIGQGQLRRWAGLSPESLELLGAVREGGQRVPLRAATIWAHANHPNSGEIRDDRDPRPLSIDEGIAVYPDDSARRLPILGLRALTANKATLVIDGRRRRVTLCQTSRGWWPRR